MSEHETSSKEIPNHPLVLHHPLPQSSFDSEPPSTETSGSGDPPEPPRRRPPTSGEFWSNNEFNYQPRYEPIEPIEPIPINVNDLLVVNSWRRNGLILYKRYHAEFAGPGSAVGGAFDQDCQQALPIGNISLLCPESADERLRGYLVRRQWLRLTKQITDNPVPLQRAQMLLNRLNHYFGFETMTQLPDEALALLVGVLPQTMSMARRLDCIE